MSALVRTRAAIPEDAEAIASLFDAAASPCFCRYWHFEGTKNAWLERCAFAAETNREEFVARARVSSPEASGVIAIADDGSIVGWMKLAPRDSLPKLRSLPVYRSLDLGPGANVLAIGCFLVHPAHRRTGVARELVAGAVRIARTAGCTLETYPRHVSERIHDEEAWMGPLTVFREAGFTVHAGEQPYAVWRLETPVDEQSDF